MCTAESRPRLCLLFGAPGIPGPELLRERRGAGSGTFAAATALPSTAVASRRKASPEAGCGSSWGALLEEATPLPCWFMCLPRRCLSSPAMGSSLGDLRSPEGQTVLASHGPASASVVPGSPHPRSPTCRRGCPLDPTLCCHCLEGQSQHVELGALFHFAWGHMSDAAAAWGWRREGG